MPVELILILGLAAVFVVPILTDMNVGVVAFVAAILAGSLLLTLSPAEILAGFPHEMFVLMVGITLLLAIAQQNGTIEWLVNLLMSLARGRLALLPWILFVTALLTSSLGPGSAPILFVIGIGFVARFNLNPLLVAAMVIHGTQSGAYSPIAPYGVVIGQLAHDAGIEYQPWEMFTGVVMFHLVLAACVFFLLGGGQLSGQRFSTSADIGIDGTDGPAFNRYLTLAGFAALLLSVLVLEIHLGFAAMTIALVLLIFSPKQTRLESINGIAWPIVLVICGVLTYVNLIQDAGAIDWLADRAGTVGSPAVIGLMLSYLVSVVTGVASTIGTIGMLVPLAAPFVSVSSGGLDGTGLLTAMAVSAAVSDISPYSTWGALFLATAAAVVDREELLKKQLVYTCLAVGILPLLAWLIFVVI